jgi:hypothetical protein
MGLLAARQGVKNHVFPASLLVLAHLAKMFPAQL